MRKKENYGHKHSSHIGPKLAVREQCKQWLHTRSMPLAVLDCFSGGGTMRRKCYEQAEAYLGLEKDVQHKRPGVWIGDTRDLLPSAIQQHSWTLIDIDPYSDPWGVFSLAVALLPAGIYTFAITDGIERGLTNGLSVTNEMRRVLNYKYSDTRVLRRFYADVVLWFITANPRSIFLRGKHYRPDVGSTFAMHYYAVELQLK